MRRGHQKFRNEHFASPVLWGMQAATNVLFHVQGAEEAMRAKAIDLTVFHDARPGARSFRCAREQQPRGLRMLGIALQVDARDLEPLQVLQGQRRAVRRRAETISLFGTGNPASPLASE